MVLSQKIKALRADRRLTQKQLGERLGVSTVTIRCWENGIKSPSVTALKSLSQEFQVSADFLLGTSGDDTFTDFELNPGEKKFIQNYRLLDRHGKKAVNAVLGVELERIQSIAQKPTAIQRLIPHYLTTSAAGSAFPIDDSEKEMMVVDEPAYMNADFAVNISGTSMEPIINDGDTVFVQATTELNIGDVGIFSVDGSMYCKQYYIDQDGNVTLVSANPQMRHTNVYLPAESNHEFKCFGKVLVGHSLKLPDYFTARQ